MNLLIKIWINRMVQPTNETQSSVFERSRGIEITRTKLPMTHIIENVKKTNGERKILTPRLEILQRN